MGQFGRRYEGAKLAPGASFLLTTSATTAQQKADPTQARLAIASRIASLTHQDLESLASEARSGNPEAQYWLAMVGS
jgi:hypothetical protein